MTAFPDLLWSNSSWELLKPDWPRMGQEEENVLTLSRHWRGFLVFFKIFLTRKLAWIDSNWVQIWDLRANSPIVKCDCCPASKMPQSYLSWHRCCDPVISTTRNILTFVRHSRAHIIHRWSLEWETVAKTIISSSQTTTYFVIRKSKPTRETYHWLTVLDDYDLVNYWLQQVTQYHINFIWDTAKCLGWMFKVL